MMKLSDLLLPLGATLHGKDQTFNRVVTDSRQIQAGDLFVALKGERFDAHSFVPSVLEQGAVAAVVTQPIEGANGSLLQVNDTRLALGQMAKIWADRLAVTRVAITGSNGKTTVKEMLSAILREAVGTEAVHATRGNFNNDIGLPLTMLALTSQHRYAVLEMGMNHFGELSYLTRLACPKVALINNALRAHLGGGFQDVCDIARAKSEIFEGLDAEGVAVINAEDPNRAIMEAAAGHHSKVFFGLSEAADIRATHIQLQSDASHFVLQTPKGSIAIQLPAAGEHNIRNAVAACAVAYVLGVDLCAMQQGLAKFAGVKGRLECKKAPHNTLVIDDTYNANPDSMKAGLDVLASYPSPTLFIMGDIGELGDTAPQLHAEVGAYAKAKGILKLLTLGELSRFACEAFGEGAQHFENKTELLAYLQKQSWQDGTILVKGSRFMKMEDVVAILIKHEEMGC